MRSRMSIEFPIWPTEAICFSSATIGTRHSSITESVV